MPFSRGKKPTVSTAKQRSKIAEMVNQEENRHNKRSPSSPQGAPKKRSAFVDITNASKTQANHKKTVKKTQKSSVVAAQSESNVKKCVASRLVEQPGKVTALEQPVKVPKEETSQCQLSLVPEEFDIDKAHSGDCLMSPEYAKDIFDYLKEREEKFVLEDYMHRQPDLNQDMRGILVDWMVEVQENFELNHETLYLAVKLTDHYLSTAVAMRETLQLIGSTSILIASKFEERCPPCVDDFLYICDDAYTREELITMEVNILRALNFDINIPVAYRFLRRYAKCVQADMPTLTLARYVCELSLLELDLVSQRASCLASACLLLALVMKGLGGWTASLEYHAGYSTSDLSPLVRRLHAMLACPTNDRLKAVKTKYSHKVFFEVAKIPPVDLQKLEAALK